MPLTVDDETLRLAVETRQRHPSSAEAARHLGIPVTTLKSRLRIAAERGIQPGEKFVPPEGMKATGQSFLVRPDGTWAGAWLKFRKVDDDPADTLEAIREGLNGVERAAPIAPPADTQADLATNLFIADAHFGQYSWGRETGEDYSLDIAERDLTQCAARLIGATPPSAMFRIVVLGDFYHVDDSRSQTPASKHVLDSDGRYQKVIKVGARALCAIIEMAAQRHQAVKVRVLQGNHDPHSSIALAMGLGMRYADSDRIEIDESPSIFWWDEWGVNLDAATHSHTIKQADMPGALAAAIPEAWGRTRFRTFYSAHVHHQRRIEKHGVVCEGLPPVTARDAYAAGLMVHSQRGLKAFTQHRKNGPEGSVERWIL